MQMTAQHLKWVFLERAVKARYFYSCNQNPCSKQDLPRKANSKLRLRRAAGIEVEGLRTYLKT